MSAAVVAAEAPQPLELSTVDLGVEISVAAIDPSADSDPDSGSKGKGKGKAPMLASAATLAADAGEGLSEYELQRLRNMERNQQVCVRWSRYQNILPIRSLFLPR